MSRQTERAFRELARRPTYERLPKTSALVWTVRHHLESSTTCEEARALRATTSRLSERIVQSLSSLGAGMRRFHEAPAAAVAASKAPQLLDDRRTATTTRRAPGPIQARGIR
jgi:hypothetical protein